MKLTAGTASGLPAANATCDVYRTGRAPPASPDAAGVTILLVPEGASSLTTEFYTHVALFPLSTDVRDDFQRATMTCGANCDTIYVPDKNGVGYKVLLVRRKNRGTPLDCKEVLLVRQAVSWPQDDV